VGEARAREGGGCIERDIVGVQAGRSMGVGGSINNPGESTALQSRFLDAVPDMIELI
jgi:hypothetical protein